MDAAPVFLSVLATVLVLAAGLVWGGAARRAAARRRIRARQALASGSKLVALMAQIQQHRGMSGAWRAGDDSFAARLPQKQAEVQRLFAALEESVACEEAERSPCICRRELDDLQRQWRDLLARLGGMSGEESFQAHGVIIARLLDWLAALGEARIAQPLAGRIAAAPVRNFAHCLPVLAECLGQGRALGSAVAARGHCPPVSRVRLQFFLARAEALLEQALAAPGAGARGALEARRAVADFVGALRDRLLGARTVELNAADCFALGTRAVDGVFAWIEAERRALETVLAEARMPADTGMHGGVAE